MGVPIGSWIALFIVVEVVANIEGEILQFVLERTLTVRSLLFFRDRI